MNAPILGMYVHQHWAYRHPYAARTWTLEDWRGYAGGLRRIGYDTVMIWPMLETMPDPPTASDRDSVERVAAVIGMLHDMQIKVHERHILPEELEGFQQCWLTGTAAEVTPVGEIGPYHFEVGDLTRRVATEYEKLVRS